MIFQEGKTWLLFCAHFHFWCHVLNLKRCELLKQIERKNLLTNKTVEKENKKQVSGQLDMFNFKLAEIAHELDKVNIDELTPIDALNTLVKIKEEMKG